MADSSAGLAIAGLLRAGGSTFFHGKSERRERIQPLKLMLGETAD
jgi:hypothetical protein